MENLSKLKRTKIKWSSPCNRPWRPIGLWDVEAPTFSRQSAHRCRWGCQPYAPTDRPLLPGTFLVLISVIGWVDPRITVRLERSGPLKNPMTPSGIKPVTFRLVAECLNQLLSYRVPLTLLVFLLISTAYYTHLKWTISLSVNLPLAYPEDGGSTFPWNVVKHLADYNVSHPRREYPRHCENINTNKKFWEEPMTYFHSILHGSDRKRNEIWYTQTDGLFPSNDTGHTDSKVIS
jgi:hypothetical protein